MSAIPAAFPFIEVTIDTSGLTPVAQRSPGVIAVVGASNAGTAPVNRPLEVDDAKQAADLFGNATELFRSLKLALLQDPKPSKIYGVKINAADFAAGLASLEAADDVTFVSLANVTDVGKLGDLKDHVETMSAGGQKRIGVAMVDPAAKKSATYVTDITAAVNALKSTVSRMVVLAARGAKETPGAAGFVDVATAASAAIAGFAPQVSIVLKKVRGFEIPTEEQYSPSEIKGLSEANIVPIIDPALIPGESLHFAEGRTFTTDASLLYVDVVRTLDDVDFRLKAGLIGTVGDARISKSGMTRVKTTVEGILGPLVRNGAIDAFTVDIPVLDILSLPESALTATETAIVTTARATRTVDMFVSITIAPAVHRLKVTLAPKF